MFVLAKRVSDRVGGAKRLVSLRGRAEGAQAGADLGQGHIYIYIYINLSRSVNPSI